MKITVPQRLPGLRPRADVVLLLLLAAHVVVKIALFSQLANAPLVGDEAAYANGGRALSNLVRDLSSFGPVDVGELQRNVVGSGWFMPGMSVVLTPLFVVDPDASVTAIRAYLGVASSLLLVLTAVSVRRGLGSSYAGVLLVFPGLVPTWLLFSYSAWGDLAAGLMIVILAMQVIAIMRRLKSGASPDWREGLRLGLVAVTAVYFRSSVALLVVAVLLVVGAAALLVLRGRERSRSVGVLGAAMAVFVLVLLPWSTFASHTLGDRVITTSSVPVGLANTFGDPERLCFGPCDPGSTIWFNPLRYSREVARATGISEVEVQREMSAYARTDVTPHSYARDVLANLGRYTLHPAGFSSLVRSAGASQTALAVSVVITDVMFFAMLAVAGAMMVLVLRRSFDQQVVSVVFKLGFGALLVQPFVHIAGSRYWTSAAPLFALAGGALVQRLSERRVASRAKEAHPGAAGASTPHRGAPEVALRWALSGIQVVLVTATLLIAVGVLALAV